MDDYEPDLKELSLDKDLPTSRENDYHDICVNGDSLHDPKISKEQLDNEIENYMNKVSKNENILLNISNFINKIINKLYL